MLIKNCAYCGREFFAQLSNAKYCSSKCWWADWSRKNREHPPYEKVCGYCGKTFSASRKNTKWCSESCLRKGGYINRKLKYYREGGSRRRQ